MVFNLVGPLIVRDDFEPLLKVIGETVGVRPGGKIRAGFEYEDRSVFNERSGQPTSIDLVVNVENTSIFVEAKLAEHGFGGCSIYGRGECQGKNPNITQLSDCYLHRAEIRYWTAMEKYDFVNTRIAKGPICPFVQFYQFFREILFSLHNSGKFLLLCDSRNPAFVGETGIWPYLFISIPRRYRDDIGVITIQQLVRTIEATGRHTDWIYDFKSKYAIS